MSGMMFDQTPEERAADIEMFTDMTLWTGKHGLYREAGMRDGRNKWAPQPVPSQDAEFQQDYDEGYADGLYWYNKLVAIAM